MACYNEAIASFDRALELQPDNAATWYEKACNQALLGAATQSIGSLKQAIALDPEKYLELAQRRSGFIIIFGKPNSFKP